MDGNGYFEDSVFTDATIGNSHITTSTLDMNVKNITNVADPIQELDAVNKRWALANLISSATSGNLGNGLMSSYSVTLTGTGQVLVDNSLTSGMYYIKVTSTVQGGPTAGFQIVNPDLTNYNSQITRTTSAPGGGSVTSLMMYWDNTGLYLNKTGLPYDGEYIVGIL